MISNTEPAPLANKHISILGCGWYGLPLAKELIRIGYVIKGSTTSPEKMKLLAAVNVSPFLIDLREGETPEAYDFFDSPTLIVCIPPKRSTSEQHTYTRKIERIADLASSGKVKHVIFISSTSVYGDHNMEVFEETPPNPDTDSGKAILQAEEFLRQHSGFATTVIRFGGLIGPNRNPGRFFAGKTDIPNGQAPVNLIHLDDCIALTIRILESQTYNTTYNACSPEHPSRAGFYTAVARDANMEVPSFKDELCAWKIVSSELVHERLGYQYLVGINNLGPQ